jgi:biopolymer transport protein ExbD
MRRFSQRNSLVTLADINITPLLDLAFVLLIIFVITTPLLEQGMDLKLPSGMGKPDKPLQKNDIKTIEISPHGIYAFGGRRLPLAQIEFELRQAFRSNPRLIVYIRADENGAVKYLAGVLNSLERVGIDQISIRTEPVR